MTKCPSCGEENTEDWKFCYSCGAALKLTATPEESAPPPTAVHPAPSWWQTRERERHADLLGLVGIAIFLLVVGIVIALNPAIFNEFRVWVERMARDGVLVRPPEGLILSASLFWGLVGLSNFLVATLRVTFGRFRFRALADVLSGVGLLALAYLLTLYANHSIAGSMVLAIEAAVVGALILVYIVIGMYWLQARRFPAAEAERPATRP